MALKGITVEINGNATPLNKALQGVNTESKSLSKELTGVNKLLKLDPKNTELLAQKQIVLKQAIEQTESKLNTLTQAQEEMKAAGKDVNDEAYRELSREIEATRQKLKGYNDEQKQTKQQVDEVGGAFTRTKQQIAENVKEGEGISKIKTAVKAVKENLDEFKDSHPKIKMVVDVLGKVKDGAVGLTKALANGTVKALSATGKAAAEVANGGLKVLGTTISGTMKAFAGFTAVLGTAAAAAIKVGSEYEASMSQVAATMGITRDTILEDGTKPFETLSQAAKEAGESTKYSASEAAEALNYLALAGYDAETAAAALPSVLNLAAAGGMDLARASDLATDAMSALGMEASSENLTAFGDQLAVTAQKSNTSIAQLGEAILTIGATAKDLAGGTTELNAALGMLADSGIKGAEGGTHLRNVLLSLQTPTEDGAEALAAYTKGVYDAEGNLRPLNDILGELNDSLSSMSQEGRTEVLNAVFNKTDLAAAQVLLAGCAGEITDLSMVLNGASVDLSDFNEHMKNAASICEQTLEADFALGEQFDSGAISFEEYNAQYDALYENAYSALGALKDVGLSMMEIENAIDSGDQLYLYAAAINEISDEAERARYAEDIFGDAVAGLEPLFQSGITDMDEMRKYAEELGIELESQGSRFDELAEQISASDGAMQDMADTMNDNLKGQATILKSELEGLGISIYENMQEPLKDIVIEAQRYITQIQEAFNENGFEGMIKEIGNVIASIASTIVKNIPTLTTKILPPLQQAFFTLIRTVTSALPSLLPQVLDAAITLFSGLLQGLNETIPELMAMLPALIEEISQTLTTNLPQLVSAGVNILVSLISGITNAIPSLITAIVDLIPVIVQAVTDNLPLILSAGLGLLLALAQGITEAIPQLVEMLPTIINTIVETIGTMFPQLVETGVAILLSLITGITEAIPQLVAMLPDIISSIITTIGENLSQIVTAGIDILFALITGLIEAIPQLIASIPQIVTAIFTSFAEVDWPEIGKNIIDGIAEGIKSAAKKLKDTMFGVIETDVVGMAKKQLGIASPSKVMRDEVGKMIPAGLAVGVEQGMDKEEKRINDAMMRGVPTTIDSYIAAGGSRKGNPTDTAVAAGGGFTQNVTINSPQELSPSEVARQTRNATRQMALRMA